MRRRIPADQQGLTKLVNQATAHLSANQSTLNYPDKAALDAAKTAREDAIQAVATAQAVLDQANQRLEAATTTLEHELGDYDDHLQTHAPGDIVPSGFPALDTTPTQSPDPDTAPGVRVESAARRQIRVHFFDPATPTSKARPENAANCQLYFSVGTAPPANIEAMREAEVAGRRTPETLEFSDADLGKTAYVRARWIGKRGQRGPWSEIVSITIAG